MKDNLATAMLDINVFNNYIKIYNTNKDSTRNRTIHSLSDPQRSIPINLRLDP